MKRTETLQSAASSALEWNLIKMNEISSLPCYDSKSNIKLGQNGYAWRTFVIGLVTLIDGKYIINKRTPRSLRNMIRINVENQTLVSERNINVFHFLWLVLNLKRTITLKCTSTPVSLWAEDSSDLFHNWSGSGVFLFVHWTQT